MPPRSRVCSDAVDALVRQAPGNSVGNAGADRCAKLRTPASWKFRRFAGILLPAHASAPGETAMVRKGSPVRVRQRLSRKPRSGGVFFCPKPPQVAPAAGRGNTRGTCRACGVQSPGRPLVARQVLVDRGHRSDPVALEHVVEHEADHQPGHEAEDARDSRTVIRRNRGAPIWWSSA
jgi:hypothetical protein